MVRRVVGLLVVLAAMGFSVLFSGVALAVEPPTIVGVWASSVGSEDATLNARIENHEEAAAYHFEYGTADCASNPCTAVPSPDSSLLSAEGSVSVSEQLHYLTPGVTYHYRILANGPGGEQASSDHAFRPFPLAGNLELPDNRAWELVSPVDKNGGGVASVVTRTRAAADGGSVAYVSLAAFGDAEGMGTTAEYESVRDAASGTQGWSTHSIMPKLDPVTQNSFFTRGRSIYMGDFSSDLANGVLTTFTNISGDSNLDNMTNLYLRRDLQTPGSGRYETLTACSICTSPLRFSEAPRLVGASSNYDHVVFEVWARLTSDAPAEPGSCVSEGEECAPLIYEWDQGVVRYVGVLPSSEGGGPAIRSIGARNNVIRPQIPNGSVSADGSRVLFAVPESNYYGPPGPLYMRIDHSSTVRISASEQTGEPDPNASAVFQAASSNLSKVFFTSESQLTDQPGGGLYVYDATKPEGHHLTLISPRPEAVMGASSDGDYLYFMTRELLLPGQASFPATARNGIYRWHEGNISLVGSVPDSDVSSDMVGESLDGGSSRVTPDGKHVLFTSHSGEGLTGNDQTGCGGEGCAELYLYSADSQDVKCVSCNPTGAASTAEASFNMGTEKGGVGKVPHISHPMSDDGRYVFFTTAERLVPEDHNGNVLDVYEYDSQTDQLHLLSSGSGSQPSFFMEASADGHDAFFTTFDSLVGWDSDEANDLYDARVGGGFPLPPRPVECEGDACSAPFAPPADLTPSSATFSGPGDQGASSAQKKPTVKKKPAVKKKIYRKAKKRHRKTHKQAKHSKAGGTNR